MRTLISVAVAMFVAAFAVFGLSQTTMAAGTPTTAQKAQCDAQRKACYAGKTQTGTYGERYVPPEAVKECEDAYRTCMGRG